MNESSNPCIDNLSDKEYLEHMIPHHQVAIDMSELLLKKTKNPSMMLLCREIIRKQGYEIWEMEIIKKKNFYYISENNSKNENINTKLNNYYPKKSKSKDGDCNPLFFQPDNHSAHMKHMEINNKSYLEHMIPHHQVAIDMSKRLLMHTNNMYLIDFCRKLIYDQEGEIFYMNNLLESINLYKSNLI